MTLTASGGLRNSDTACSITTGALPSGLSIAQSGFNCQISGTPTATGSFAVVATITDSNGATASTNSFTIVISDVAPGQPTITGWSTTSTSISLSFLAGSNSGSPITKYQYSTDNGSTWQDASGTSSPLAISSLTLYTTYSVKIRAFNSLAGTASSMSSITTSDIQPTAPTITGITPTSSSLSVAFTAGSNSGTAITKYQYSTDGGSTWADRTDSGTTASPLVITKLSSNTATSLSVNTSYSIKIRAYNSSSGIYSSAVSASTSNLVPNSPTSVTGTRGDSSVVVNWTVPTDNGGSTITSYTATSSPGSFTCNVTGASTTSCTVTGLTNGTAYTFSVVATNSAGNSTSSTSSASVTPLTTPGAPTSVSATSNANTQSVITWSSPVSNGGAAITNYLIEYSSNSGSSWTAVSRTASTATSYTLTGLVNGTGYIFRIAAISSAGTGSYSTSSATATPSTTPGAPTSVSATANENAQSTITWTAPTSNGGAAIDYYKIQYSPNGSTYLDQGVTVDGSATSYVATGLTNGTGQYFKVAAHNASGLGSYSTATLFVIPKKTLGAAEAPTVTPVTGDTTRLTVGFTKVASADRMRIRVYANTTDVSPLKTIDSMATSSEVVTALTAGTDYWVSMQAVTVPANAGSTNDGAESARVKGTTLSAALSPTITAQPTNITRTYGQKSTFSVIATASDGGTLSYQWRKDGVNISGATSATYTTDAQNVTGSYGVFTVVVKNTINGTNSTTTSNGVSATYSAALTVTTPSSNLLATVGNTFSYQIATTGGASPLTYYLIWNSGSGTLPAGLSLDANSGLISGTPTTSGDSAFLGFQVIDANYDSANCASCGVKNTASWFKISVAAAMAFSASTAQNATVGTAYSQSFAVTGGNPTVTYSGSGTLPTGLSLSGSTISGTPTTSGTFNYTLTATDSIGATKSISITFTVSAGTIPTVSFSGGIATDDGYTVSATGIAAGYTYEVTVPSGSVTLAGNGTVTVTGVTPSGAGTSVVLTLKATRSGYTDRTFTYTGTTKGAALVPTFGAVTKTSDGFYATITNYTSTSYQWNKTSSAGGTVTINTSTGVLTVTGLAANTSSTLTVTTVRAGYVDGTATISGTSRSSTTISVALAGSATTATYGTAVILTATAAQAGTVTFKEGTTALCSNVSITASPWTATCSWTPGTVGTRSITAEFTPANTADYSGSISTAVSVVVGKASLAIPTVTAAPGAGSISTLVLTFTHSANSTGTYYALYGFVSSGTVTASGTVLVGTTTATITGLNGAGNTGGITYYLEYYAVGNTNYTNSSTQTPRDAYTTNPTWSINYDSTTNGGAATSAVTYVPGATALTLPTPSVRNGYTQLGWYDSASGGTKVGNAGATYTPTGSITLYFQWSATVYTITYNRGPDGTGSNTTQTFTVASAATLLNSADANTAFTRTGYSITGWTSTNTSAAAKTNDLNSSYNTSGNITLYPVWTIKSYVLTVTSGSNYTFTGNGTFNYGTNKTVTFTAATGFTITSIIVDGTPLSGSALSTAVASGVVFNPLDANHTLSAVASGNSYSVTFDRNGGTSPSSNETTTFTSGGSISKPTVPTRSGYLFLGWYDASTSGSKVSWPLTPSSYSNKTYYAYWKELSFTYNVATGNTGTVKASDSAKTIGISVGQTITLADATSIVGTTISTTWKTQNSLAGNASGTWSTVGTSANYSSSTFDPTVADIVMITMEDSIVVDGDTITASITTSRISISTALTISAPPDVTLPINKASTTTVSASGGKTSYTYAVASGALPTGMALNTSTGAISMYPSAIGTFTFTLKVTDSNGAVATTGTITYTVGKIPTVITAISNMTKLVGSGIFTVTASRDNTIAGTFTISSSNTAVATVSNGQYMQLTPVGAGTATITVTWAPGVSDAANYASGSTTFTLEVTKITIAQPNAPNVVSTPGVLHSFNITWTAATGASSYTAFVYDNGSTPTLVKTITGLSGTSATLADSGLFSDDTTYKISIQAIGGGNYLDSAESAKSTGVKTAKTYTISYGENNATSGTAPTGFTYITGASAVTVSSNSGTLARTGFTFAGWNTQADGNGTSYTAGTGSYNTAADSTLFAKWTALVPTITSFTPSGPTYGSTVTITGTNFSGATSIKIGTTDVVGFTVVSSTSITFTNNATCCTAATITVTTPGGSATSATNLSPQPEMPTITSHPANATVAVGQSASFSVSVTALSDGGTLSYQWKRGTTTITGATSATYSFTPTALTDAANFSVVVTNTKTSSFSVIQSNSATLTVNKGTQASLEITSISGTFGTNLTLTVTGGSTSGTVTYTSPTAGCSISGNVLSTTGALTCVVTATMSGGTNYNDVSSSATNVVMGKANQATLDFLCGSCSGTPSASTGFIGTYNAAQSTFANYQRYELSPTNFGSGTGAYTYSITSGTATNCQIGNGSTPSNIGSSYLQNSNSTNSIIWVLASTVGTCNLTLTRAADANYNSISVTALFTFNKANQSVTFSSKPTAITWGDTPAKVTATSTSGNSISYRLGSSLICSLNGDTFTILKVGTCHYYTSALGNDNYSALSENYWDFTISAKALTLTATDQSINYGASVTQAFSVTNGTLVGSDAISGVTYRYAGISPTVYTSSTTVPTAPGSYSITISSAVMSSGALTNYTVSYATGTLTISKASQTSLSISSTSGSYGTSLNLTSTGGTTSGSVTYSTSTAGCSISAGVLTSTGATTCVVTATMAGNTNYNDVSSAATNVVISARPITLTVGNQSTAFTGSSVSINNSFTRTSGTLAGSDAISGMTYTYTSGGGYNSTTPPTNVGTYTITGSAAVFSTGTSSNYDITYVTGTLTISASSQAITFTAPSNKTYGDLAFTVSPTASSSLTVVLASTTTSVCTVSSFTVTIAAPGTCTLTADQGGDSSFSAATQVSRSFTVAQAAQATLTISATTTSATSTGTAFTATPTFTTGSSGSGTGAVTYAVVTGGTATCTLSNSSSSATLTATTAGTCLIAATKASDNNYLSATSSNLTFTFSTATQSITFTAPSTTQFSAGSISVSGTSSSGLTVAFTSGSTSVCTVSGTTVTFVSAGSCVVNADQSGNTYYSAATQVQRTFTVSAGTQATLTASASITTAAYTGTAYTAIPSLSTGSTGSGTGAVTYAIATGGNATNCQLSSSAANATLTADSSGTCYIKATKASDSNYNSAESANLIFTFTKATLATPADPTVTQALYYSTQLEVSWSAVSNASSYTVSWYDAAGSTRINTAQVLSTVFSYSITPLVANTTYKVTVRANGTSNYANSAESNMVAATTKVQPAAPASFTVTYQVGNGNVVTATGNTLIGVTRGQSVTIIATVTSSDSGLTKVGGAQYTNGVYVSGSQDVSPRTISYTIDSSFNTGAATGYISCPPSTYTGTVVCLQSRNYLNGVGTNGSWLGLGFDIYAALSFTTPTRQTGTVGTAISSFTPSVSGGKSSYAYQRVLGLMPPGLSLDTSTGAVTGTPTASGSYSIVIRVTDANGASIDVTVDYTITALTQTISFSKPADKTYGDTAFTVAATSSSNLSVVFTSATTSVCTVSGTTVNIVTAGTCTLNANQAGDTAYSAATQVQQSFTVNKATQATVNIAAVTNSAAYTGSAYTATPTLSSTGGSGNGSVTYAVVSGGTAQGCSLTSGTLTATSVGTCLIAATKAADTNYLAGTSGNLTFTFTTSTQTITFTQPADITYGATPPSLSATSSSGLSVAFTTATSSICTVAGSTLTILKSGTCTINANQIGDSNYSAATQVAKSFAIAKATPVLSSLTNSTKNFGDSALTITDPTVTGSIPGTFTYTSASTSVATVSGAAVTPVAVGTSVITALFTPTDTEKYNTSTVTMTLTVAQRSLAQPNAPNATATAGVLKSFTVTWTAVTNAVAYALKIYAADGTTLLQTVSSLSGTSKTVTSTDFSTIADNTGYKVGIVATGDSNNSDSVASALSSLVTTNKSYVISYSGNNSTGGTTPASGAWITGATATTVASNSGTLARTGYSFAGWNSSALGTGTDYVAGTGTYGTAADITLYAKWTAGAITITYNPEVSGGTNVTETKTADSAFGLRANTFTRAGFTFAGWATTSGGSVSKSDSATVTLLIDTTYYAVWTANKYTVTYNGNSNSGGSVPTDTSEYLNGASVTVKANSGNLVRTGYSFVGWTIDAQNTGTLYLPSLSDTTYTVNLANMVFYAKWEKTVYVVSYNGAGGSDSAPSTYSIGDSITLPTNPTKSGYTFNGWFAASTGGTALGSPYAMPGIGNITLFAQWSAIGYTVTYNGNNSDGGTVPTNSNTYTIGTPVPVVGNTGSLTRAGYTFAGWTEASNGSGTLLSAGGSITAGSSNINFYAKWTPVAYSVTYSTAGSTSGAAPTDSNSYTIGNTVSVAGNLSLAKTGYSFTGWTVASDGSGTVLTSGNAITIATSNVIFYPKWSANTYTISFNSNGASGSASKTSDSYTSGGSEVTLATVGTMSKTGYQFAGWSTTTNGTALSGTFTTTSSVILYALWSAIPYTISYDPNGGSTTPTQSSLTMGQSFTLASGGSKPNGSSGEVYAFVGWSNGSSTFQAGYNYLVGTSNVTLTAVWIRVFTVKYSLNGSTDTPAADQLKNDGDVITLATAPTRTGYEFAGWKDQSGTTYAASATYTVGLSHYLLYAQWNAINYTVTYSAAGGTTTPIQAALNYGQTFNLASAITRTGYSFSGWSDGTNTYGAGASILISTSNLTFTAQWTADVYTISYDLNGGTGSSISNSTFTFGGTAITLPLVGDHVRTNYTFGGWSITRNGSDIGATYSPNASGTVYAIWTLNQYVITYNAQLGTVSTSSATYTAGGTALTLPTPTRTSFVFKGWYSSSTGGNLIGVAGATYSPSATATIYAQWTQLSLSGVDESDLQLLGNIQASASMSSTVTLNTTGNQAAVTIPAGALPANTVVTFNLLTSFARAASLISGGSYILSMVISWVAPDGTVPDTASGKPITMVITNAEIKKGATVYAIAGTSVQNLGVATQDGSVTVEITQDPEVVVVKTAPSAPRNVTGTASDGSAIVTWSVSSTTGGSPILSYEAVLSDGQMCVTTALTCTFTGLTNGTSYTVSVRAANAIGFSPIGNGAGSFTPVSATPPPTPPTPPAPTPPTPTSPSTPSVAEPVYVAPVFETTNFARSVVFADSKFELPGKTTTGSVLKWRTTSSACSVTTVGMITWNSTGLCSLIASVGAAEIAYAIQIDPRTEVIVQEITQVQSSNLTVNATVKWPGQAFDLRFCVGKSTNKCLFNKIISINSLEGQTLTADGDLYITTTIAGLSPRSEYDVFATVIATNKSLASNVRSIKTPAGIAAAVSGATTITLGQDLGLTVEVSGEGSVTSLRAVGLPAGVSIARTATGGSITGKPRAAGVYFVTVKLTDSFRQMTDLPVTIVVNQVGSVSAIVNGAIYKPTSAKTTLVSWKNIAAVKSIQVKLGASVVCTTTTTSCVVKQLLGPKSTLQIIATNSQGAVANPVLPIYVAPKKLVEVGTANFATNSTVLSTAQKNAFKKVAADMEAKGFTQLTVYGYSDQTGTKATNDKISLARATAIYSYLKVLLAEKNLTVTLIGKGFKDPVASNATAAGRAANRRAVVSIG